MGQNGYGQSNQSNWDNQSSWNYGYNNAQNMGSMRNGQSNGYQQTWQPQNGYNGQQYNGQQPGYQYNKPVETLESIRHKFNSTAKWLKAMGIISQILMCCGYSVWLWTESHSDLWTETYVDDYGISGMAKLGSLFVGFFGLMLLIWMICLAIPLFICQVMYNKPGKRPDEIGMKITSIVDLLMCLLFCMLGYWVAVPTLIVTVILQFIATSLRTRMESKYVQQTGQNMNMDGQSQASYGQNMTGQNMNGQNMNGQNGYVNNQSNYGQSQVYQGYSNINNQTPVNRQDVFVTDEQDTQEQKQQDQVVKNDNTVSEKVTSNQENINTETNKEQIQSSQPETIEENDKNQEENQDQEKPEREATENGGGSIE